MSRRYLMIAVALLLAAPAAFSQDCSVNLEGNDLLQFNLKNIDISKACGEFTINLKHVGKQPRDVMGHNVVIAKTADMAGIDADAMKAGLASGYIKAGDARVIAHSKVVGGGEATAIANASRAVARLAARAAGRALRGRARMATVISSRCRARGSRATRAIAPADRSTLRGQRRVPC